MHGSVIALNGEDRVPLWPSQNDPPTGAVVLASLVRPGLQSLAQTPTDGTPRGDTEEASPLATTNPEEQPFRLIIGESVLTGHLWNTVPVVI